MLSIVVPHYNFKNEALFTELEQQCLNLHLNFEIIIIDDASIPTQKTYLQQFKKANFKIILLEKNIGRAAIRNLLAAEASYPFLLFLDGDSYITNPNFIINYINFHHQNPDVDIICGLRNYPEKIKKEKALHHYYGIKTEIFAAKEAFHSNNFFIKKEVFKDTKFDESLSQYGYEDVLFGLMAKAKGYTIKNLYNPVIHLQLKTNKEFITDTDAAVKNLAQLMKQPRYENLLKEIPLVCYYLKLKRTSLLGLFKNLKPYLRKSLEQENPNFLSLKKLQFYKLLQLDYFLS